MNDITVGVGRTSPKGRSGQDPPLAGTAAAVQGGPGSMAVWSGDICPRAAQAEVA